MLLVNRRCCRLSFLKQFSSSRAFFVEVQGGYSFHPRKKNRFLGTAKEKSRSTPSPRLTATGKLL
jgi:hypothetical protein